MSEDTELQASLRTEFEQAIAWARGDDDLSWRAPRNHCDHIAGALYCGGDDYLYSDQALADLKQIGITHVLDCRAEHRWEASKRDVVRRKHSFVYRVNGTNDDLKPKSVAYFKRSLTFGIKALADPKAKLFVHCAAGINRGPSSAYAILRAVGYDEIEAEGLLRTKRPGVWIAYLDDAEKAVRKLGLHAN